MEIPKRRVTNTIGVKYVQGKIKDNHYEQIIENILNLRDEGILKIEEVNSTYFTFKVERPLYERISNDETCKFIRLDADSNIIIEDISSYETEVKVQYFGLELEEADIIQIFSTFGVIKHYYHRARPNVKYFLGRETGRMIIKMELNRSIPSALYIRDTKTYIHVGHENQAPTCHNCGDRNHKKIDCRRQEGTGSNAFDLDPDIVEDPINNDDHENDIDENDGEDSSVWSEAAENIEPETPRDSTPEEITTPGIVPIAEDAETQATPPI